MSRGDQSDTQRGKYDMCFLIIFNTLIKTLNVIEKHRVK